MFCQYQNILGEPGKGIHKARFLGFAQNDIIGTIILAWFLNLYFKINYFHMLAILFVIAILLHRLFCVPTTLNKIIFA